MSGAVYWQEDYNYRHETFVHRPAYEMFPPPSSMTKNLGASTNGINMPHQEDENGQMRRRVPMACQRCRKRKIKCSGEGHPLGCTNCQAAVDEGVVCNFWRMGTSHELVLAEPDQGSSSRRPSALNTSAAMQAPEGYDLHNTKYLASAQSSVVGSSGTNMQPRNHNQHPSYGRLQQEMTIRESRDTVPFGYDNSGIENYGPHVPSFPSNGSFELNNPQPSNPSYGPVQTIYHGLPAIRESAGAMDGGSSLDMSSMQSAAPHHGRLADRQLPPPSNARTPTSPANNFSIQFPNNRAAFSHRSDSCSVNGDRNGMSRTPSQTPSYPDTTPAPMGYIFSQTPDERSPKPTPQYHALNPNAPRRISHTTSPYMISTMTPVSDAAARRNSSFNNYSYVPDADRNDQMYNGYAQPPGTANMLVNGQRYAPLAHQPQLHHDMHSEMRRESLGRKRSAEGAGLTSSGRRGY